MSHAFQIPYSTNQEFSLDLAIRHPDFLLKIPNMIQRTGSLKSLQYYRWVDQFHQLFLKYAMAEDSKLIHIYFDTQFNHWVSRDRLDKAYIVRHVYSQSLIYVSGQDAAIAVATLSMNQLEKIMRDFPNKNFVASMPFIFTAIRKLNKTNLQQAKDLIHKVHELLEHTEATEWKAELYQCLSHYHFYCAFQTETMKARYNQVNKAMTFSLLSNEISEKCSYGNRYEYHQYNGTLKALKISFALPLSRKFIEDSENLYKRATKYLGQVKELELTKLPLKLFFILHQCTLYARKAQLYDIQGNTLRAYGQCGHAPVTLSEWLEKLRHTNRPGTYQQETGTCRPSTSNSTSVSTNCHWHKDWAQHV